MISLGKLERLPPGKSRLRKAVLVLTDIQTGLMAGRYGQNEMSYLFELSRFLESDSATPKRTADSCRTLLTLRPMSADAANPDQDALVIRALDSLRHVLLDDTGQSSADWDLIDPCTGRLKFSERRIFSGMTVYCEDIRSPFNLGAIFRTSDACGAAELILSPGCVDPRHPRCSRSAMGAMNTVPYCRTGLEALTLHGPAFALELGGTEITEFDFPEKGIVVLGSEELGVSPEALACCSLGKVSIPMSGSKGSLNVAVAAGILLHAWRTFLEVD